MAAANVERAKTRRPARKRWLDLHLGSVTFVEFSSHIKAIQDAATDIYWNMTDLTRFIVHIHSVFTSFTLDMRNYKRTVQCNATPPSRSCARRVDGERHNERYGVAFSYISSRIFRTNRIGDYHILHGDRDPLKSYHDTWWFCGRHKCT